MFKNLRKEGGEEETGKRRTRQIPRPITMLLQNKTKGKTLFANKKKIGEKTKRTVGTIKAADMVWL